MPTSTGVVGACRLSLLRALAPLAILALASGFFAASAKADGDPASDVLVTQQLFLPLDAGLPATQQTQLATLLQEATRGGFTVRVALIASPSDLGSVTALWRQPQNYARFLGQELAFTYHGPLLVVMPDGFGLYHFTHPLAAERSILAGARAQRGLGTAALSAVRSLAANAGHALTLPSGPTTTARAGSDSTAWIVFIAGAIIIALAWAASLRARPPRLRHRRTASP